NTNPSCGVSVGSNRYININPAANWYGYSDVTVRVTDPGGLWSEDTFRVTVYPINDPPVLYQIPNLLVATNTGRNNAIDLWVYAYDVETSDNNLVYTITGNTNPNCGVSIDVNDFVDIYPSADWTGYSDVTIRATDEGGLWAEKTFRIVVATPYSHIGQARSAPDGTWVSLADKISTAKFTNYYYVEEPTRTAGIRVSTASGYDPGYKLTVAGPLSTSYAERQITPYYQQVTGQGLVPGPLEIRNDWLGGGSPDSNTPSVPTNSTGLYNVGLLVRTTGRVINTAGSRFFISDGGKLVDNTSAVPSVLVDSVPSGYVPPIGSYVSVTGISGASTLGGNPMRILRPRTAADIVIHELSAAFIYDTNADDAEAFKKLLDHNSVPTTLIPRSKLLSANLNQYNVILVGSDTGDWSEQRQVEAIVSASKPVIGIGRGGAVFLDKVTLPDLYIGWGNSAVWSDVYAVVFGGNIYDYPYELNVEPGSVIQLFTTATGVVGVHDPQGVSTRLLMYGKNENYFPLCKEASRFYQWGFYDSPQRMTDLGRKLFVNLVFSTVR
ncbi:MAG: hypothetical protein QHI38_05735, partial [Armatimonadota bacterium]|nr:hypothetical protein [Armatimonadota bacterium]